MPAPSSIDRYLPPERMYPEPPAGTYEFTFKGGPYFTGAEFKWTNPFDTYGRTGKGVQGQQHVLYLQDVRQCCGVRYLANFGYPYNATPTSPEELASRLSYVEQGLREILKARGKSQPQDYAILVAFIAGRTQHEHFLPLLKHYGFEESATGRNHNGTGNQITLMQKVME